MQQVYGYKTRLLLDVTRADIIQALGDDRRTLSNQDNLIIYYAGYGWLDKAADQGYWLPVDADRNSEVNWISNATITASLKANQAKHVLVVADSCYSGKLTRRIMIQPRTSSDHLARIRTKRARLVLSSRGLEPVEDGSSTHSVFARAFLQTLDQNPDVMDGTTLFSILRRTVMINSKQTPEYADMRLADHDGGDFIFVKQKK